MIKVTITYINYYGNKCEEEFYFDMTKNTEDDHVREDE